MNETTGNHLSRPAEMPNRVDAVNAVNMLGAPKRSMTKTIVVLFFLVLAIVTFKHANGGTYSSNTDSAVLSPAYSSILDGEQK